MPELSSALKSLNTAQIALVGVFATSLVTMISTMFIKSHNRRSLDWQKDP